MSYWVEFYKDVFGVPFPVVYGSIKIRRARTPDRAIKAAKLRFERRHGIAHWHLRADRIEIKLDEAPPPTSRLS